MRLWSILLFFVDVILSAWFVYQAREQLYFGLVLFAFVFVVAGPAIGSLEDDRRRVWLKFIDKRLIPVLRVYMIFTVIVLQFVWGVGTDTFTFSQPPEGDTATMLYLYALAFATIVSSYLLKGVRFVLGW